MTEYHQVGSYILGGNLTKFYRDVIITLVYVCMCAVSECPLCQFMHGCVACESCVLLPERVQCFDGCCLMGAKR